MNEEEESGVYAVLAEFKNQGPILMECEGPKSSFHEAQKHADSLASSPRVSRIAVVHLSYVSGNALLLTDMKRMHK